MATVGQQGFDSLLPPGELRDDERYHGHDRLDKFELPCSLDDLSTVPVSLKSTPDEVVQWLRQPCSRADPSIPTMKILLIQTRAQSISPGPVVTSPLPPALFRDSHRFDSSICDAQFIKDVFIGMKMPLSALGAYIKASIAFIHRSRAMKHPAYCCSGQSWSITWTYSSSCQHTAAVLLYRNGDGEERKDELLKSLLNLQWCLSHPLILGYTKTAVSFHCIWDMLDNLRREIFELEREAGFPTFDYVLNCEVPGRGVDDLQDHTIHRYSVLGGKLTSIRFRLKMLQQQIKFITRCNSKHRRSLDKAADTGYQHSVSLCDELDEVMDNFWDSIIGRLLDAESLSERLHNVMTAIYQLTTQRDSAIADLNNEIAWQGKNNNASMITIAFVSLLFLPGTYIASLFDTPIFNFPSPQAASDIIVTKPFWIYWTVSGLLTLGLGFAWMCMRRRRDPDGEGFNGGLRDRFRQRARELMLRDMIDDGHGQELESCRTISWGGSDRYHVGLSPSQKASHSPKRSTRDAKSNLIPVALRESDRYRKKFKTATATAHGKRSRAMSEPNWLSWKTQG